MVNSIVDVIPYGKENAISRTQLLKTCLDLGIVATAYRDPDRMMRQLIAEERDDHLILNNPNGGYYQPTYEDLSEIESYILQEESRAKSIFKSIKFARAVADDLRHNRIELK